jgi:hypothetical protein
VVALTANLAPLGPLRAGAEILDVKKISRFSVTSSQIILYLNALAPGETRTFEYSLRAKFPLKAQTPPSTVYEYYTPSHQVTAAPVTLTVTDKK